jgi:hypothetical protein
LFVARSIQAGRQIAKGRRDLPSLRATTGAMATIAMAIPACGFYNDADFNCGESRC